MTTLADEIAGTAARPRLPGTRRADGPRQRVTAIRIEVVLEGFGIHTRRHFGGALETHPFFARGQMHAALMDLWAPVAQPTRTPVAIPYGSTPLWAEDPQIMELHYGGPRGWLHQTDRRRPTESLSLGTMEAMAPGTRLHAALWGDPDTLPPDLEPGRGFYIGKGRAPCSIVAVERKETRIATGRLGRSTLPIEIPNDALRAGTPDGVAYRTRARAPWYTVLEVAPGSRVETIQFDAVAVPILKPPMAADAVS